MFIPNPEWKRATPEQSDFNPNRLAMAQGWLERELDSAPYRLVIVRNGHIAAEWNRGLSSTERRSMQSAGKSVFACVLGIVIAEGKVPSADAKLVDYYPEACDVPPGTGPKPGRHAFDKDRAITFRQLISNTSGYMKPGEEPGEVFHYQTYGMTVLTHALAKIYGLYDPNDPTGSPGFRQLIDRFIRLPIHGTWDYRQKNFDLDPDARLNIFGYSTNILITAQDMARLGWLWCNAGRWGDQQLVPADWLREATQTAPDIRAHCPREQWVYGYGFWVNDEGILWPNLPRESFAARGADGFSIWVCPSADLVVVQGPGLPQRDPSNAVFYGQILNALQE